MASGSSLPPTATFVPIPELRKVRDEILKLGTDAARTAATRERVRSSCSWSRRRRHAAANPDARQRNRRQLVSRFALDYVHAHNSRRQRHIFLADVAALTRKSLTAVCGRTPGGGVAACREALVQLTLGGRTALFRMNPNTGKRKEIIGGRRRMAIRLRRRETKVAYIATSADAPTRALHRD